MTKLRKSGGDKGPEPRDEELEFVYSRLDQLSDSEILAEMQDGDFPLRSVGFIKRRRAEFRVAKKVLETRIEDRLRGRIRADVKAEQDPLIAEKRREHNDKLVRLIGEWTDSFDFSTVKTLSIDYPWNIARVTKPAKINMLFDCLMEHLSEDALLKYCDEWERLASAYEEAKPKVLKGVEQDVNQAVNSIMADFSKRQEPRVFSDECSRVRSRWGDYAQSLGKSHGPEPYRCVSGHCEPVAVEGNTLVLEFYDIVYKDIIEKPEYTRMLEEKLVEVFGTPNKIRCTLTLTPPPHVDRTRVARSVLEELDSKWHTQHGQGVPLGGPVHIRTRRGVDLPELYQEHDPGRPLARAPNAVLESVEDARHSLIEKWKLSLEHLDVIRMDLSKLVKPLVERRNILIEKGHLPGRCRACPDA